MEAVQGISTVMADWFPVTCRHDLVVQMFL